VSLAKTLDKRGNKSEANSVMLDLLRVSSMPVPQNDYGPRAQELHNDAEKQAQTMARGSLTVSVSDSRAMIFVDYTYRGLGRVALGDQLPGAHHVLVQVPGTPGLQYVRDIRPGAASSLGVNWQMESILHTDKAWTGFLFSTETERVREWTHTGELARSFDGSDVIILFMEEVGGKPYIGGIQYPANGQDPIVAYAPASQEGLLRSLGTYLYNGTMAAGLRVLHRPLSGEAPSVALTDSDDAHRGGMPGWVSPAITVAGAAVITSAAVVFMRRSYDPGDPPSDGTDGRGRLVAAMAGGSLGLGGGVYLWTRDSLNASRTTAGALGLGVTSLATGIELYLVDQDPSPTLPRYIRHTEVAGFLLGTTGIALTGAGLWLLHREHGTREPLAAAARRSAIASSCQPFASVGASDAVIGCGGSF
jgi:hypothetical protein